MKSCINLNSYLQITLPYNPIQGLQYIMINGGCNVKDKLCDIAKD